MADQEVDGDFNEQWQSLLRESREGMITMTELMRRSLRFFSFGDELEREYAIRSRHSGGSSEDGGPVLS